MNELERLAANAIALAGGPHDCRKIGHKWKHVGGANAGCGKDCSCSIPVYECEACGDCDYGDNLEAVETMADCLLLYDGPRVDSWEPILDEVAA